MTTSSTEWNQRKFAPELMAESYPPPSRFHMRVQPRVCPRQAPARALPVPSPPLNPPTHLAALAGGLRLSQILPLLPSPSGGAAAGASLEVACGGDEVGGRHRRPARGAKRVVSRRLLVLLRGLGLLVLVTKGAASVRAHAACPVHMHMHMCRVCSAHSVQMHMQCTSSSCSPAALPLHVLLVRPLLRLRVGTARDQQPSVRASRQHRSLLFGPERRSGSSRVPRVGGSAGGA